MESILHKIRFCYKDFGPAEKKLADYILQNTQSVINSSISEVALNSGCGDATVVRFSRRLGFDGFGALKIGIAGELNSASSISGEIKKNDSCFEIFKNSLAI